MKIIPVTKSFLPPIEDYEQYLKKIWKSGQLTNQGPLVSELEDKLKLRLDVDFLHFVTNGTLALQLALNALDITEGEVITTPFSYVATTSSILWERCKPVFVDILPDTFCIDPSKIEKAITKETKAIMAVHVFGIPCDVERIEEIAKKHKLKVIYDGAHAFGVKYKGKSLLSYGDISTCSFHATKLFHTIEGGCVITRDKKINQKIDLIKRFGHNGDEHYMLGMNAKASEFQAAMGLCNLMHIKDIISERRLISCWYDEQLNGLVKRPIIPLGVDYNYSYYVIVCNSNDESVHLISALNRIAIYPRRYFYPSLNELPYLKVNQSCPNSEDIAGKIIALPLYHQLQKRTVSKICTTIREIIC